MSVGCLEPAFFKAFLEGFVKAVAPGFSLNGWIPTLDVQFNREEWPKLKEYLTRGFATRGRDYWAKVFHGQFINICCTRSLMRVCVRNRCVCSPCSDDRRSCGLGSFVVAYPSTPPSNRWSRFRNSQTCWPPESGPATWTAHSRDSD